MTVRKIRNSWWVDFRHEYVRYRKKSPENSKPGAQAYEAVLRQKLARGETLASPQQEKSQKEREQKFKDFAWKWFNTYVKPNNKPSEISRKKYTLLSNLIPNFGETQINKITTLQIEEYKADKIRKGLKPKSINNHLTVLSACLRAAEDWFDLPRIPKIKKLKIPPLQFDFLSFEEADLLLSHLEDIWREIVFTALKTGLRVGELRGLDWSDINWNNKTLTVKHSWCDYKNGLVAPKSNKTRQIPLVTELYLALSQRKQVNGFVFLNRKGHVFSDNELNRVIAYACKKAGLRTITCHTLRHTYASHLVMRGAPLKAIQELLGHANIQTTMRYAHLSPSSLREAVNLLETNNVRPQIVGQQMGNGIQQAPGIYSIEAHALS